MRKKYPRNTIRWNNKNQIYLNRLGLVDSRSGKAKDGLLSNFINSCVSTICESQTNKQIGSIANSDELREAYIKFEIITKQKERDKLEQEMADLVEKLPIKQKLKQVI